MIIDIKSIKPRDLSHFAGYKIVRTITALYLVVMIGRSCVHFFASDGGAQSIAGIDVSVAGGDNIVAIFHQWGATQLILATLLLALSILYPGLTPIVLLTLAVDPIMRFIAGNIMHVTTEGTPPGELLNLPSFLFVTFVFLASLVQKSKK